MLLSVCVCLCVWTYYFQRNWKCFAGLSLMGTDHWVIHLSMKQERKRVFTQVCVCVCLCFGCFISWWSTSGSGGFKWNYYCFCRKSVFFCWHWWAILKLFQIENTIRSKKAFVQSSKLCNKDCKSVLALVLLHLLSPHVPLTFIPLHSYTCSLSSYTSTLFFAGFCTNPTNDKWLFSCSPFLPPLSSFFIFFCLPS